MTCRAAKASASFCMAAARVHEKIPQARFLIIGRGSMAEILRADIARLGLAGKAWLTRPMRATCRR